MGQYENILFPILFIGMMLIGVLFSYVYPRGDARRAKATAVFVLGAALLLGNWLMQGKDVLLQLREHLGWILLGMVITFARLIMR